MGVFGEVWGGVGALGEVRELEALLAQELGHEFVRGGSESAQRERAEGDGAGSRVCRAKFAFLSGEACGALPTPDPQEETSHAGRLFRGLSGENPRFRRGVETRG